MSTLEEDTYYYIIKLRLEDPSITDADAEEMFENLMNAKKKTKKKNTVIASLRSSKDKKFMGHTGRG